MLNFGQKKNFCPSLKPPLNLPRGHVIHQTTALYDFYHHAKYEADRTYGYGVMAKKRIFENVCPSQEPPLNPPQGLVIYQTKALSDFYHHTKYEDDWPIR